MNMKLCLLVVFMVSLVATSSTQAQTTTPMDEALTNLDKMMSVIKVGSVIGDPIRVQNTIIIPFSKISYGLGAGGAMMGYGGGMGAKTIPLGFLIIEGEDVRVELFQLEEKKPSFLQEMLPILIKMLPEIMGKKLSGPASAPEKSSGEPVALPKDVSLSLVEKLYQEQKYQDALGAVDSLIAADPNNAQLHAWKGSILGTLAQGGNPADMIKYGVGAMQEFEKALSIDPNNVRARFGRGVGRLMAPAGFGGDVDGAIEDFKVASEKDPFPEAYFYLGEAYKKKGLNDMAIEAYQKALSLNPEYKEAERALEEIK